MKSAPVTLESLLRRPPWVRERKCPVVPGTQGAQGWASRPGFRPLPRVTLTWLHPHLRPINRGWSQEGESFRLPDDPQRPMADLSQAKLGLPHPKRGRAWGNLDQEGDPEEALSLLLICPLAQLLQEKPEHLDPHLENAYQPRFDERTRGIMSRCTALRQALDASPPPEGADILGGWPIWGRA